MSKELLPAPWQLQGRGYLFLYRFRRDWLQAHGALPEGLVDRFAGGLGALMLVDYQQGDAEPYQELLFMPGKFRWDGLCRHAITAIWVSTAQSVASGRQNWAIPKRLARFQWPREEKRINTLTATGAGLERFEAQIRHWPVPVPMHTALLPMPLAQPRGNELLLTAYRGRGLAYPARLEQLSLSGEGVPPLDRCRPLAGFHVSPFRLGFPVAECRPLSPPVPAIWDRNTDSGTRESTAG